MVGVKRWSGYISWNSGTELGIFQISILMMGKEGPLTVRLQ